MGLKKLVLLTVLPIVLMGTQASAATISFTLDQSNALPNGFDYLQVNISDSTTTVGDIDFEVLVNSSAFPGVPVAGTGNFGMDNFYFNFDNSLTVGAANIIDLDPSTWDIKTDKNAGGGFGFFNFDLKGSGSTRTEVLTFTISGVSGDSLSSYAVGYTGVGTEAYFAAHVGGFDDGFGVTSGKFATVVPVPAAVWLFGSGLLGLVAVSRRKV